MNKTFRENIVNLYTHNIFERLQQMEKKMSTLEQDVATITTIESNFEASITSIQTLLAANQATIASLQSEVTTLQNQQVDTSGLEAIIAKLQSDSTTLASLNPPAATPTPTPTPVITGTPVIAPTNDNEAPIITPTTITSPATPVTVTSIGITPFTVTLEEGSTQQFTANVTFSDNSIGTNEDVTWSASNGKITTGGVYTTPSGTSDTITATAQDNVTATATVTIIAAATTPATA